jgi:hypothetical protein
LPQHQFPPNQNRSRSPAKRRGKQAMNKLEKQNSGLSRRDLLRKHGGKTGEELKSEVNKLYRSYEEQN